jgi:hypothetical protein
MRPISGLLSLGAENRLATVQTSTPNDFRRLPRSEARRAGFRSRHQCAAGALLSDRQHWRITCGQFIQMPSPLHLMVHATNQIGSDEVLL